MKRYVTLNEISDGRLYTADDLVRAGCHNCSGCDQCCHDMGRSIILDPWDIHHLVSHLSVTFEMLLQHAVELNVADGVILPNLRMHPENGSCYFLDENHRCSIHSFRPGLCRLFPLARYYDAQGLHYIIQKNECVKKNRKLIQVQTWIDMPQLAQYEHFVKQWHDFRIRAVQQAGGDLNGLNLYLLRVFYQIPWEDAAFYQQFAARLKQAEDDLGI